MTMPWHQKIGLLIGQPVGISLTNGQGTSSIFDCSFKNLEIKLAKVYVDSITLLN